MVGDVVTYHDTWEADHPVDADHARGIHAHRMRTGQPPLREFPCRGKLIEDDDLGTLMCDRCFFRTQAEPAKPATASW